MGASKDKRPYLLIGSNIRFLAENAAAHGHSVYTIDHYGDWDTRRLSPNKSILRDGDGVFSMPALCRLTEGVENKGIVFGPGFENDLDSLSSLHRIGTPLGCSIESVRKSGDPNTITSIANDWGFCYPESVFDKSEIIDDPGNWLIKPVSSLGGEAISFADTHPTDFDKQMFYQRYHAGIPSSALIVSCGSEVTVLAIMTQLVGEKDFGAYGFRFVGNVYPHPFSDECATKVRSIAEALTLELELVGLWGFDFVFNGDVTLIEINPRPPAGIGVYCQAVCIDLLDLHLSSLVKGGLKQASNFCEQKTYWANARIFARQNLVFRNPLNWYNKGAKDIPYEGEMIETGSPILTLAASGNTYKKTICKLRNKASSLYEVLGESQSAGLVESV